MSIVDENFLHPTWVSENEEDLHIMSGGSVASVQADKSSDRSDVLDTDFNISSHVLSQELAMFHQTSRFFSFISFAEHTHILRCPCCADTVAMNNYGDVGASYDCENHPPTQTSYLI